MRPPSQHLVAPSPIQVPGIPKYSIMPCHGVTYRSAFQKAIAR